VSNKKVSVETQLIGLKAMFQQFGVPHQLQLLQLKYWPHAVDPNLEVAGVTATVNFDNSTVFYEWTSEKVSKVDKNYLFRLRGLFTQVKWLFGEEWKIQVLLNGELIFGLEDCTEDVKPKSRKKPGKAKRRRRSRN
jgi:hypothetical protein